MTPVPAPLHTVPGEVEPEAPLVVTAEYFDRLQSGEGMAGPTAKLAEALSWPVSFA
jgi:hypothetical protein